MNSMPFAAPITRHRAIKSILLGGFLAGVLDGLDAVVFFGLTMGATAVRIFQYIAAGLIGPVSYQGGWRTVALGVLLHFTVATGSATVYYLARTARLGAEAANIRSDIRTRRLHRYVLRHRSTMRCPENHTTIQRTRTCQ